MDTTNYPVVNIKTLTELILDCAVMANFGYNPRPTLVLSPPGSGKTETAERMAKALGRRFVPFELGLTVPEEVGGVPVRDPATGAVVRFPLGPIRIACEQPSLLLIDEVTRADATRQGAAMTGVNERRWGDHQLHPGTVIMLAGNEPDSGGVFSILDALLNRCCVVRLRTERDEVRNYLRGGVNPNGDPLAPLPPNAAQIFASEKVRLQTLWADYSEGRTEMISEEPPKGFSETGALWPSGRAVVHACTRLAARAARGMAINDEAGIAHVGGTVGREVGVLWDRLNDLAGKLPSIAEINQSPDTAKIPPDVEASIASLGMLPQLSPNALWVYLARYPDAFAEIKAAAAKRCQRIMPTNAAALTAFNKLMSRVHKAVSTH
jgi:hypothetical protein